MHELLHVIGLCPDSFAHIDLLDIIVANFESLSYIHPKSIKSIKSYVIKRRSGSRVATNK